jgi:hypothetical protein
VETDMHSFFDALSRVKRRRRFLKVKELSAIP